MIDHLGITVSNFEKSRQFYVAALAPLGMALQAEYSTSETGPVDVAGFGTPSSPEFWFSAGKPTYPIVHVAFRAGSREMVDEFHQAAMAAGGTDNGAPGLRPHYGPTYYAAFVLDPDGHNIEAVFQGEGPGV